MFPEKVKSITLDKVRFDIILNVGNMQRLECSTPEYFQVEDFGLECSMRSNPYMPDYVIKGYWLPNELEPQFIVEENGPHFLYITGVPKNIIDQERKKFRFPNLEHVSYWEDNCIGYLFQVVSRDSVLNHLIKNPSKH